MVLLLHTFALLSYLMAGAVIGVTFARDRGTAPRGSVWLLGAAVVAHVLALAAFTLRFDELPLVGLAPSFSTLAFLIGGFLLAATIAGEARPIGLILTPLVGVLLGAALVLGVAPSGEPLAFRGVWFSFHVVLAFLGYAGFAIAFAAGLCYLLQFRELKSRHFGRVFRFFPSLPTLDRLGWLGVAVGFPALTAAIALGWAWTIRFRHSFAFSDPKIGWAVLTWLLLGAVLAARAGGGGRARLGALLSVVGFGIVVLTYVVLRLGLASGRVFL